MKYAFTKQSQAFKVDRSILRNGTYIRHDAFEPVLGYRSSMEIDDAHERKKRGLAIKMIENQGDSHLSGYHAQHGDVYFETTMSTDLTQTAIAPGELIKKWTIDRRSYFKYKFAKKNIPALAYFSANYDIKTTTYKDVDLEYYYHPGHDMNHSTIDFCTQATLEYCNANFGDYPLNYLRIAETPSFYHFGGTAHPG